MEARSYPDVPHHLDGEGESWGLWSAPLSWGDDVWGAPWKKPDALCHLQVPGQHRHGGLIHSSTAALANGLPYQVLLQLEALPASSVQRVREQLAFLGENGL